MDLNEIKLKFKHKAKADLKDLDLILEAMPFLVREIERLEKQIAEYEKRIEHLSSLMKRKPPLDKKGQKGESEWQTRVDEEKNRLYIELSGKFDYKSAKLASNGVITVLPNLREEFDVIVDISKVDKDYDRKALFHIKKIMFSLKELGVKRLIRIDNPEAPGFTTIFKNTSKEDTFQTSVANSVSEGEDILENVSKFLKT